MYSELPLELSCCILVHMLFIPIQIYSDNQWSDLLESTIASQITPSVLVYKA
jgi:hypothetical protein